MLILASASPRRKDLLQSAGLKPRIVVGQIDEAVQVNETALDYVFRMSREKGEAVEASLEHSREAYEDSFLVSADTIVVLDGEILGKPRDADEASKMLKALSGRWHSVFTSVYVKTLKTGAFEHFVSETRVTFTTISEADLNWYLSTGEAMDKAGSYGIQGSAARFVVKIDGSYTNVVGLPLCECINALKTLGFSDPVLAL